MTATRPQPSSLKDRLTDADFVDRVWQYLLTTWPTRLADIPPDEVEQIKHQIRRDERGDHYVSPASEAARQHQARQILALFNGRNATEVARRVGCSRAKVYRVLKQAGKPGWRGAKSSHLSL